MEKSALYVNRPNYVWDTRSPLRVFIAEHKQENQNYWAMLLCLRVFQSSIRDQDSDISLTKFISTDLIKNIESYERSFSKDYKFRKSKSLRELSLTLNSGLQYLTEHALISYLGLFEKYLQCWVLNFLLSKLEQEIELNKDEINLISTFNRRDIKARAPNTDQIIAAIPDIREILISTPHVFTNEMNEGLFEAPISNKLNACESIYFWKDWRNLIVHSRGIVNVNFYNRYQTYIDQLRSNFLHIPKVKYSEKLRMNEAVFKSVTTTHYHAAKALREFLVHYSKETRGHSFAPGPDRKGHIPNSEFPKTPPRLLMKGDHYLSYENLQST